MPYTLYVSLGDSMSTDHSPTCDVRGLDQPPARLDPLGAAALLHRNDDSRWHRADITWCAGPRAKRWKNLPDTEVMP
jgi:hypothetical protein